MESIIITNEINDNQIKNIIDDLLYKSYAYNRQRFPDIHPDKYVAMFGHNANLMELKYQEGMK